MENVIHSMVSIAKRSIAPVGHKASSKLGVLLWHFANITDKPRAEHFIKSWGLPRARFGPQECVNWARNFQRIWDGASPEICEALLGEIFKSWDVSFSIPEAHRKELGEKHLVRYPAIAVDWRARKLTVRPRDLLDLMALTLLEWADDLKVCEMKGCPAPFYIASKADQMYCPNGCAKKAWSENKKAWWKVNGERHRKKWRRKRKQQRLAKARREKEKERKRKGTKR